VAIALDPVTSLPLRMLLTLYILTPSLDLGKISLEGTLSSNKPDAFKTIKDSNSGFAKYSSIIVFCYY
jgi:hypothetical protein